MGAALGSFSSLKEAFNKNFCITYRIVRCIICKTKKWKNY